MKHIKIYEEYVSEARKTYLVVMELAKLAKMDLGRAERAVDSFLQYCTLDQSRQYHNAASDKAAAAVVKKHWLGT